jgi:hypothetical protein
MRPGAVCLSLRDGTLWPLNTKRPGNSQKWKNSSLTFSGLPQKGGLGISAFACPAIQLRGVPDDFSA